MNIALICDNRRWRRKLEPWEEVQSACLRLGHEVCTLNEGGDAKELPGCGNFDAVFVWNGMKGHFLRWVDAAKKMGATPIYMERGFFDRMKHTQFDIKGFSYRASWAKDLLSQPPKEAEDKFVKTWGDKVSKYHVRKKGYVLLPMQIFGDAQLQDAEIKTSAKLALVIQNGPHNLQIMLRPHPRDPGQCGPVLGTNEIQICPLNEAINGAKYIITINSNLGHEALASGVPVLCLGPSLYEPVANVATLSNLSKKITEMEKGWHPEYEDVKNYLYNITTHQFSEDEIEHGNIIESVLNAATTR